MAVGAGDDEFHGTGLQVEVLLQNNYRQQENPDPGTVIESRKPMDYAGEFFDPFPGLHHCFVTVLGPQERCRTRLGTGVDVCPTLDQDLHYRFMTVQ
ncbi:hypothetical protein S7711_11609 [Stachybotrys chartarum IBT 7711]|uniref:Uncharacterized protein n=1 Tax=Stachybotrys chartarum (strain CBS 109288 / IBT 7711) TaxID=1280523 RepID=A0A084B867_STACB|nr:hypothetical protein S7711_11609 [Stachybotrys chartarum IBT 7711]